jgi:hypothetical protein
VKPAPVSGTFKSDKPLTQLQIAAGYGYEPTQYESLTGTPARGKASVQDALSGNAEWSDVEPDQRKKLLSDPSFYKTNQITKYPAWMQQRDPCRPVVQLERATQVAKGVLGAVSNPKIMASPMALAGAGR